MLICPDLFNLFLTHVGDFLDRFLGCKMSTYTRVNTVADKVLVHRMISLMDKPLTGAL